MSKERIGDYFKNHKMGKKSEIAARVVTALAITAGIHFTHKLMDGITLVPDSHSVTRVNPEHSEFLSSTKPITIAHRNGNSLEGIQEAAAAGMSFVEADLNKIAGKLYADHGENFEIEGFIVGGVDIDSKTVRLGDPNVTMHDAFKKAGKEKIGLFIDLKRGDINESDIRRIKSWSTFYEVPMMLHSGRADLVNMALKTISELEKDSDEKTLVLDVPGSPESWGAFFGQNHKAVLTDRGSARKYREQLKANNVFVIIGDANTSEKAVEAKKQVAVNGFMAELSVLTALFPK